MPIFGRKPSVPKPPPRISIDLPAGEEVERGASAELMHGSSWVDGTLFMTNRRLLFEAKKGEARWMIVPYAEMLSVGLFPAPGIAMGVPSNRRQCLFIETTAREQVWWNFGDKLEREWLPIVQERASALRSDPDVSQ